MTPDAPQWSRDIARFSSILDDHTIAEGPLHLLRIRCSKIHEEAGEVEDELIAVEGSNPRKLDQREGARDRLRKELLDVATAALGALEHETGNVGISGRLLAEHCAFLVNRVERVTNPPAHTGKVPHKFERFAHGLPIVCAECYREPDDAIHDPHLRDAEDFVEDPAGEPHRFEATRHPSANGADVAIVCGVCGGHRFDQIHYEGELER